MDSRNDAEDECPLDEPLDGSMADAAPPDWEKPVNLLGKVLYRAMWRKRIPGLPFFGELSS